MSGHWPVARKRTYLLTGDSEYLQPYDDAASSFVGRIDAVARATRDNPRQQTNLSRLVRAFDAKLTELGETIALRRTQGMEAAFAVVATDRGKVQMDAIRQILAAMRQEEMREREGHLAEMETAYRSALTSGILSALLGAALTVAVFVLTRRTARARSRQQWLQTGQVGLSAVMFGEKSLDELADSILGFLSTYLGFQAGALFTGEQGQFRRTAVVGVPADADIPARFSANEGLMGRVASDGAALVVNDVPDGYLTIGSALGRDKPRHLVIAPAHAHHVVNAVMELGFLQPPDDSALELLDQALPSIGVALPLSRRRRCRPPPGRRSERRR